MSARWRAIDVLLNDVSAERIKAGMATINGNMARQVGAQADQRRRPQERARRASRRPRTTTRFGDCDLVIEAATEKEDGQAQDLRAICAPSLKPEAIIATNTSSISITRLAAATDRPERFIGIHFMNPVPLMELVELIRGIATDDATFEAAQGLRQQARQDHRGVGGFPRLHRQPHPAADDQRGDLHALRRRRHVEAIDTAMRLGAHHPMGPLELADFIGLDTCLSVMQVLHEGLADSKYRPCPLLVKYVEAGWLGRKTQRGFYDYRGEKPVPTR